MSLESLDKEITGLRFKEVQPLRAPAWADSGHGQTIFGHIIPSPTVQSPLEELTIPLVDGDKIKAYHRPGRTDWIVSVFPGLGGDITADYMQRTAILCEQLGHGVVIANHRGAHTGIALAKKIYHSGSSQDISDVIDFMKQKYPGHRHICIGVSISGTIVLNLMTGRMGSTKPEAAITINGPLDLLDGSQRLKKGLNRFYDFRFVRRLNKDLEQKFNLGLLPKRFAIPLRATVFDFDAIFTGPMSGYGSRESYYEICSPKEYLQQVDRPLIMLHAADDPFVDVSHYLDVHKKGLPENVQLHIEARGGHLGYLAGGPTELGTNRWLDYFLVKAFHRIEKQIGMPLEKEN
jgi:predicted alpha/beta-fold hydrolase